jgi:hypothetical protein
MGKKCHGRKDDRRYEKEDEGYLLKEKRENEYLMNSEKKNKKTV